MRKPWYRGRDLDRDDPDFDPYNGTKQVYDAEGQPTLLLVPTVLDEHGQGVEFVYCTPAMAPYWDARRWR